MRVPGFVYSPLFSNQYANGRRSPWYHSHDTFPILFTIKIFSKLSLFHITDWLPTLYSMAGGTLGDLGDIDGKDMWQAISGESCPSEKEDFGFP